MIFMAFAETDGSDLILLLLQIIIPLPCHQKLKKGIEIGKGNLDLVVLAFDVVTTSNLLLAKYFI